MIDSVSTEIEVTSRPIAGSQCDRCLKREALQIVREPLAGQAGVDELLIVCSNCGHREHSCYVSRRTEAVAEQIQRETHPVRRAKLVRRHKRIFERLQSRMRALEESV